MKPIFDKFTWFVFGCCLAAGVVDSCRDKTDACQCKHTSPELRR